MVFYDVLCPKSILGFLLSERTSGVSLVIFKSRFLSPERMSLVTFLLLPLLHLAQATTCPGHNCEGDFYLEFNQLSQEVLLNTPL